MNNKIKAILFTIFSFLAHNTVAESEPQNSIDHRKQQLSEVCGYLETATQCKSGAIENHSSVLFWLSVWAEEKNAWITLYSFFEQEHPLSLPMEFLTHPLDSIYQHVSGWQSLVPEQEALSCAAVPGESCGSGSKTVTKQDKEKIRRANKEAADKKRQALTSILNKLNIDNINDIETKLLFLFPPEATHDLAPLNVYTAISDDERNLFQTPGQITSRLAFKGLMSLDANGHPSPHDSLSWLQEEQMDDAIAPASHKDHSNGDKPVIEDTSQAYDADTEVGNIHTLGDLSLQDYVADREQQLSSLCESFEAFIDCKSGVIESGPVIFNWLSVRAEEKGAWVSLYSFFRQGTPDSPGLKPLAIESIYKDSAGGKIGWKSLLTKEKTQPYDMTFDEWADHQREALQNPDRDRENMENMKRENEEAVNKKLQEMFSLLNTLNIETTPQIKDTISTFFPKPGTYDLAPSRVYTAHIQENTLFFAREFAEHRTIHSAHGLVFLDANGHAHPAIQEKQVVDSITLSLEKEPSNLGRCFVEERYKNSAFSLEPDTYIDEGNTIIERGTFWNGYYRPEADGLFRVSCLGVRSTPANLGLFEFRQMFFVLDGKAIPLSVSVKPEFKPRQ